MKISADKLKTIINRFKSKNILVVGDLILDHHIFGKVERVSPEAPVPVVWANRETFACGGAANVGLNLHALGAKVSICGVVGKDDFGKRLFSLMIKSGINTSLISNNEGRPTTRKTRIIAHNQQVVRVDWESIEFLTPGLNRRLISEIKKNIDKFDAVIVEDYGKGVINPDLARELVAICNAKGKIVTVDPKEEHFDSYKNVTALTPNLKEAQFAVNTKAKSKDEIILLGKLIIKKLQAKALLITLGEKGMFLFTDKERHHIATAALEVFDVTGAGDTVISVFTLSLASGASYLEAAAISNLAAGIVVGKLGAATTNKKELFRRINGN